MCRDKHREHDKLEPGFFKQKFRCSELLRLGSKTYCCYDTPSDKLKLSSKGLHQRLLEQTGDDFLEKYRKVVDERVNITSTNRDFRTIDHTVETYEQTKRELLYFHSNGVIEEDGIQTTPLNLHHFFSIITTLNGECCFILHFY